MKCVGELLVIDLKGYNDGVNVFLEEFWNRIQRQDGWKAPPSQSVSRDKNAYLSRSRIVG